MAIDLVEQLGQPDVNLGVAPSGRLAPDSDRFHRFSIVWAFLAPLDVWPQQPCVVPLLEDLGALVGLDHHSLVEPVGVVNVLGSAAVLGKH